MDWFTSSSSSRPLKSVEFYQQKVLHFLHSAEGREDLRCLNIPFPQLGFYSPMHFITHIPSEMCEPFRSDKLFLATNGEIRKGDKVLLVESSGSEGSPATVQSAVFKGRRIGKSGEPEISLEGHRRTYTEEDVVPYKAYLRDQLGIALVPEENYVISRDGILEWEEPTWEPGQEVYYKPEKRWAEILSDEISTRGRIVVNLKMEQTNFKKEKVIKIPLDDLKANSVPLRLPLKHEMKGKASSVDDLIHKVNEEFKEIYQVDSSRDREHDEVDHAMQANYRDDRIQTAKMMEEEKERKGYESRAASSSNITPKKKQVRCVTNEEEKGNEYAVVMKKDSKNEDKEMKEHDYEAMRKKEMEDASVVPVVRPKRTKRPKERPVTEYIPNRSYEQEQIPSSSSQQQQQPPLPERNRVKRQAAFEQEPQKFKSCNNLNSAAYSDDDDLEPFELMNYTNSLRSSARKIIQRQLAEGSGNRSSSLKLRHASTTRPHVTEVFAWNDDKGRMTRRSSETTAVTQKRKETHIGDDDAITYATIAPAPSKAPVHAAPSRSNAAADRSKMMSPVPYSSPSSYVPHRATPSPNNLNKSKSQPDVRRDAVDSAKKPSAVPSPPPKPLSKPPSQSQNPLDYNFLPLSSSELVKKQLAIVNRVLHEPQFKGGVLYQDYIIPSSKGKQNGKIFAPDPSSPKVRTCASSDSSSQDNDSGRGSYQFLPENVKGTEELVEIDHVLNNSSVSNGGFNPEESVYANENMTIYSQNGAQNQTHSGEDLQRESSPTRRYTKNRSASRNGMHRYSGAIEDNESEEEVTLPQPFNPENLTPVAGYGRGIQGTSDSTFVDAPLYALFSCTNIFDRLLLFSKPGQVERGIKRDVRRILRDKIVMPLRTSAYCKADNVTHLREAMLPLSSKMHSDLMDAREFLILLLDSALNTESFIEFSNGTKDFMHQIIARPKDRSKSQTVQFMLETSLGTSNLKFKHLPYPALFLCMPRCKGRLVYYDAIIPSLHLNVTRLLHKGPKQCVCEMAATLECILCHQKNGDLALDFCQTCKGIADQVHFRLDHNPILIPKKQKDEVLNLQSIICTRGNHHVCFVKVSEQRLSPWLFFDPLSGEYPEVTLLEDFGKWLDSLEKQPGHYREFAKLHPLLKRIMTDSHIYIYSKTHMIKGTEHKESMRI